MAESVKALKPLWVHPNDTEPLGFAFSELCKDGVTVSEVVSIVVSPAGELALAGGAVIAGAWVDDEGRAVAANEGVDATPSGQVAGNNYLVTVTVTLSNGANKAGVCDVYCRDGSE